MSDPARKRATNPRWLVLATAVAAPFALGVEVAFRSVLMPPSEIEQLRLLLGPILTKVAWVFAGLAALATIAGIVLLNWLIARAERRLPLGVPEDVRQRAILGPFLLATSVPQLPAILATVTFTMGASLTPVVAAVAICTVGVGIQAARLYRQTS